MPCDGASVDDAFGATCNRMPRLLVYSVGGEEIGNGEMIGSC